MLIAIFGESCTGKTTLAEELRKELNAQIFTGKDYKRLAKNEALARSAFKNMLIEAIRGETIIWVISEREDMAHLPDGAVRVLVTAKLELIIERFTKRMHGQLPQPVATMLERKHGCFDHEPHDFHVVSQETDTRELCKAICAMAEHDNVNERYN